VHSDKQNRESNVHGRRWHSVHGGYFADPQVARPFLSIISQAILSHQPDVVADLGGGTGFILSELKKQHPGVPVKYVNVDISPRQLNESRNSEIDSLQISATKIVRGNLVNNGCSLMLVMRSLLHYLGCEGVAPFLKHLRAQMKTGETMVHQTACFETHSEADCANHLYALMKTPKWYPTVINLRQTLIETGWQVVGYEAAQSLRLISSELAERYTLSQEDVAEIRQEMVMKFNSPAVFTADNAGFTAFLHYRIFTCRAR
jgi:hypothetical protein